MSASADLTAQLRGLVLRLEDDLRSRLEQLPEVQARWRDEHDAAASRSRTAAAWESWRDDQITQVAVAWVLTTVFIRFCEDNHLVDGVWLASPDAGRRQQAMDAQQAFLRSKASQGLDVTDREWILDAIAHLSTLPATANLVDPRSPLWLHSPSGDAATALLDFWRARDDDGNLLRDLTDPGWDTRFLGDLYQDLSDAAKKKYALLQTPEFVEEFILNRAFEPALAERPLDGFKAIDPTCGSGHFLLGMFDRLLDRWHAAAPGMDERARVQKALDSVYGVDINPYAVAIARFRLTVAALRASGGASLENAPAYSYHLAVGDSLLFGNTQTLFGDADIHDFAYTTEDRDQLETTLRSGQYDVVVGNPPYITVKDPALNAEYRSRYASCKGTYALTVPFMERFYDLAKSTEPAGWTGQITSNSFMKREFGSRLIEDYLPKKDLRLVADTSGAYIPGHGTPTVILVGRNTRPSAPTVRAILGIRGEPGRPDDPASGIVWTSITTHVGQPGWTDDWITVADLDRTLLSTHPWSLSGGGAVELQQAIARNSNRILSGLEVEVGRTTHTGADDAFYLPLSAARTRAIQGDAVPVVLGEDVRDFKIQPNDWTLFPYDESGEPRQPSSGAMHYFWRTRTVLANTIDFQQTKAERGLRWFDHSMFFPARYRRPLSIAFAFVATHNHFVLDRGGKVFNRSAPVIKLPEGSTEEQHYELLTVLNSSVACFWLKQNSHNKGSTVDSAGARQTQAAWEDFYEFTGTTLKEFPLPAGPVPAYGTRIDQTVSLGNAYSPEAFSSELVPGRRGLDGRRVLASRHRSEAIGIQEELDWAMYRAYGLIEEVLTLPLDEQVSLELGQRAFEIVLARQIANSKSDSAWFARHGSTPIPELPAHWPDEYRKLVTRRIELIETHPFIGLLERPEYKRRWASEPWEVREKRALANWLLDRLEDKKFWFDSAGRPATTSVQLLADQVSRDEDLVSVLRLWDGRQDIPVATMLGALLDDQTVPFLAAYRYKDSGLRKRTAWERTWDLQRQEDAGIHVGTIAVPPKYATADFIKQSYWSHRGKLDVPKERFILYPNAGRDTDPTPVLGWAGWDHAQQSLALATLIGQRNTDGWPDERLVPLIAGLAELLPWVTQWHNEFDPLYGDSPANFFAEQLAQWSSRTAKTTADLAAWRPEPPTRGRRRTRT